MHNQSIEGHYEHTFSESVSFQGWVDPCTLRMKRTGCRTGDGVAGAGVGRARAGNGRAGTGDNKTSQVTAIGQGMAEPT